MEGRDRETVRTEVAPSVGMDDPMGVGLRHFPLLKDGGFAAQPVPVTEEVPEGDAT